LGATRIVRHSLLVRLGVDATAWGLALAFAALIRYDLHAELVHWDRVVLLVPVAVGAQLVTGSWAGLYTGRWRIASFDEAAALVRSTAFVTVVVYLVNTVTRPQPAPRSVVVGSGVTALMLMGAARCAYRAVTEAGQRPTGERRLLVFGAGEGGHQAVRAMLRDPTSPYLPVALLDDNPARRNLRLLGVPVVGDRTRVAEAARQFGASGLLIAVPSAGAELIAELSAAGNVAGLEVKILPSVSQLLDGRVAVADIRDVSEEDLLGRRSVDTDMERIADYVTGKRVLVTGAGGSIGSELCRQLSRFSPAELIMADRDESALHAVQLSIAGRALLDTPDLVLIDIRDRAGLARLFAERHPQVVFHAAALKHLPLLERHPAEAVKTNVWGTLALLDSAIESGVERFVNISTDKAADPVSVLGYSKRISERLTAQAGQDTGRPYLSVRFGNVLGSRGSVLGTFRAQIDRGGPITVTHPEVTRYFMTIEEAVQLVIQAGALGRPGEALVLDMGDPIRIDDVARVLISRSDSPVDVIYTGLRPGEKLHEVLLGADEADERPLHPLISHVPVPPLAPHEVQELEPAAPLAETVALLRELSGADTGPQLLDLEATLTD